VNNEVIIETAVDRMDSLENLRQGKITPGLSTGWKEMDEFYKIIDGQLNVVSGYPGSGKSEWVDSVMVRQCVKNRASVLYYSPENWPSDILMRKLIEKRVGKPIQYIDEERYNEIFEWLSMYFYFISAEDRPYSVEEILNSAENLIRKGVKLKHLIIDPWNEAESFRGAMSETDFIGLWLMNCRRFARKHNINIWIVCHPAKPQKEKNGTFQVPTLYDLAGSAHWYNKADNAFIVHRDDKHGTEMKVHIKKIKNRYYGKIGELGFDFIKSSGDFRVITQYEKQTKNRKVIGRDDFND